MPRAAYTVLDCRGRRMVLPKATSAEAIDTITRVFVGRNATPEQRAACWARLRDHEGYRLATAAPLPSQAREAEMRKVRTHA